MENFCAFIGDIVNSRKMDEDTRRQIQDMLIERVGEYNSFYEDKLAAMIDLCAGDQIQALFNNCWDAYNFACQFREDMYPIEFRIGLGLGGWTVRYPKESSNLQDGTAYHNARHAIECVDNMAPRRILFYSGTDHDVLINTIIGNEERIFSTQTETQRMLAKIINRSQMIKPVNDAKKNCFSTVSFDKGYIADIASETNTSPQNVSKSIKRGNITYQKELQAAVILLMKHDF